LMVTESLEGRSPRGSLAQSIKSLSEARNGGNFCDCIYRRVKTAEALACLCFMFTKPGTLLGAFANSEKRLVNSFIMSVRLSARKNSPRNGRIFMKFNIWAFLENLSGKLKFFFKSDKIMGTLHEDLCTFMIISC
jgi:hypothetical protein